MAHGFLFQHHTQFAVEIRAFLGDPMFRKNTAALTEAPEGGWGLWGHATSTRNW